MCMQAINTRQFGKVCRRMHFYMYKIFNKIPMWAYGLVAAGAVLYIVKKGGIAGAAQSVGAGAVGVVDGLASGLVLGLGDVVGLPRTEKTACELAMQNGDNWKASFVCDAATFLKWQNQSIKNNLSELFN